MSQAKRSHVRAMLRWREQAVRLVSLAMPSATFDDWAFGRRFDVAVVRAYCERLVAEGERLAMERVVFADWTRTLGRGPEAYRECGGWPGPWAARYGWERCKACEGAGGRDGFEWHEGRSTRAAHARDADVEMFESEGWTVATVQEAWGWRVVCCRPNKWLRCTACKGRGRTRKPGIPPGFANGDSLARTAKRLLDTLDGRCPWAPSASAQTSECQYIHAPGRVCDGCRGTGHNLVGVLPEIEWSPALLRKLADMPEPSTEAGVDDWITRLLDDGGEALLDARDRPRTTAHGLTKETRAVPRGEHRRVASFCRPALMWTLGEDPKDWPTVDERITARGVSYAIPHDRLPRWRRGEHGQDIEAAA